MKRQETASDIERNALMEESVLSRIQQLQMGLLQLTDATTAVRLYPSNLPRRIADLIKIEVESVVR